MAKQVLRDGAGNVVRACEEIVICDPASEERICCPCPAAVQSLYPAKVACDAIVATIAGVAEGTVDCGGGVTVNSCNDCASLNDAFELPQFGDCDWRDTFDPTLACTAICPPGATTNTFGIELIAGLYCCAIGGTEYRVVLYARLDRFPTGGGFDVILAEWHKTIGTYDSVNGCELIEPNIDGAVLTWADPAALPAGCGFNGFGANDPFGLDECDFSGSTVTLSYP